MAGGPSRTEPVAFERPPRQPSSSLQGARRAVDARQVKRRTRLLAITIAAVIAAATSTLAGASSGWFVIAGTGVLGVTVDGTLATIADLNSPASAVPTPDGGYLIADTKSHSIRRVAADGRISTVAGNGVNAYAGDGLAATLASLNEPSGIAVTPDGGFLVADSQNHAIRKVSSGGTITTVAGTGVNGSTGDGGPATSAQLKKPTDIALTGDGGFVIAEHDGNRIRKVGADGVISTVAGGPSAGFGGDGGAATDALLNGPSSVAVAADGGLLIADTSNNRIRRVSPGGTISTVAGTGASGLSGDGGPATSATLSAPEGIFGASDGGFIVGDGGNDAVRHVTSTGTISTVLGGLDPDTGRPIVDQPADLALTSTGRLVVAEVAGHQITGLDAELPAGGLPPAPDLPAADVASGVAPGADSPSSPAAPRSTDDATVVDDQDAVPGSGTTTTGDGAGLAAPAPPIAGERLNAVPVSGVVTVRLPGRSEPVALGAAASVPVGATIDTSAGALRIETVPAADGSPQAAVFSGGAFRVVQRAGRAPVTELRLVGGDRSVCRRGARRATGTALVAQAAARGASGRGKRVVRRLWGSGRGRFRTRGTHAVAVVRGTRWLTADRCDGTLVRVREGVVGVTAARGGRTVLVRRGQSRLVGRRR